MCTWVHQSRMHSLEWGKHSEKLRLAQGHTRTSGQTHWAPQAASNYLHSPHILHISTHGS